MMRMPFFKLALLCVAMAIASQTAYAAVTFRTATSASSTGLASSPSHVGAGDAADRDNCGNITPSIPGGAAGDLLIALVVARDNGAAISMPGWNSYFAEAGQFQARIYWRIATGGDPNTITQQPGSRNCDSIGARISRFRGVDTAQPFETNAPGWVSRNSGDLDTGTITTTSPTALLLVAGFIADNRTVTQGSGWDESFDSALNMDSDAGISLHHQAQTTAGNKSINGWDFSDNGNDRNYGAIFALRPAPAPTSLTIAKPTGTSEKDVLIASISVRPGTTSITPPANWVQVGSDLVQNGGSSSRLATYRLVAGAAEPASYTWSFSGSHTGAVGGIATFSGVDLSTPIDAQAGQTTGNGTNHQAPGVTTTQPDGMLVTIHEFSSAATWTATGTMTEMVDVSSIAPNDATGISMQMNYEARPAAGATGTRTATASGNDDDTGATQSISLKPAPLICTTDDFNRSNGAPGANWIVSNSGGSFGNPVIRNNRLRLTDATGNVATMATLQRLFPGAGNRIEVEFEHYAYGGNGADGIVLVLSDYAATPAPGGYGGSLGYAQNTSATPSKPGFSGGWLGVGIDEYGNFSNPTEGRQGGPGERSDSVAIRGSGTGTSGYRYHTGTSANLNPQVDNNGAANPPHRYRIIVDHSNGTNAWVSVERDAGSGYVTLIPPYDAKAQSGQSAVPANWILSYTGSTGGSTNIHEIDSLRICATSQQSIAAADHYAINHGTSGVNCQPETVTITAKDISNVAVSANGATITVTARRVAGTPTGNRGDWVLVAGSGVLSNGTADDGVASYTFATDEEHVVLALKNTHQQTVNIDVADGLGVTEASGAGNTEPGYNQNLAFTASGFRITDGANPPAPVSVATQTAGVTSGTYALQAIRTDTNTGACVGAFADNTDVNIDLAFQCNNPTTCQSGQLVGITNNATMNTIAANPNSAVANYTARTLRFGANSQAPFTLVYPDVGQLTLHARHNIPLANGNPSGNLMLGSSNAFVVKPYDFLISDIKRTAGGLPNPDPEATDAGSAVFVRAGEAFSATVTSVNAQGNATPNYGRENAPEGIKLTSALVSGLGLSANPALANASAFGSFNGGAATGTTFSWGEVGIITLTSEVADGDYLGAGNVTGTPSPNVGRFIPDHFTLSGGTLKNRSGAGCAPESTFTYMDEPLLLEYALSASSVSGGTTQNYQGAFAKLNATAPAAHGFGVRDVPSNSNLSARLDTVNLTGAWSSGTADIDATIAIARAAMQDGPYNELRIGIAPADGDGVRLAATTLNMDVDGDASNDHAQIGTATQVRFGRLRVFNALGSERLPLPVSMQLEYWNGTAFVVNTTDSCTTLLSSDIAMSNYQNNLAACKTAFVEPSINFAGGKAIATLASPVSAPNNGSVDLRVNLGTPAGNRCATAGAGETNATSAARSYLKGRWNDAVNGAGYDDDPVARASFGIYGAQKSKRFIYSRENY